MNNLLTETRKILQHCGKDFKDVRFITSGADEIPLESFLKLANKNYSDGFGITYVNTGLKVVGDDWWLERNEYDGSEWWEFKTMPVRPVTQSSDAKSIWC